MDLVFFMQGNWDYGITPQLKLGLRDYTPFEIGITGLRDPHFQGPTQGSRHQSIARAPCTIPRSYHGEASWRRKSGKIILRHVFTILCRALGKGCDSRLVRILVKFERKMTGHYEKTF